MGTVIIPATTRAGSHNVAGGRRRRVCGARHAVGQWPKLFFALSTVRSLPPSRTAVASTLLTGLEDAHLGEKGQCALQIAEFTEIEIGTFDIGQGR